MGWAWFCGESRPHNLRRASTTMLSHGFLRVCSNCQSSCVKHIITDIEIHCKLWMPNFFSLEHWKQRQMNSAIQYHSRLQTWTNHMECDISRVQTVAHRSSLSYFTGSCEDHSTPWWFTGPNPILSYLKAVLHLKYSVQAMLLLRVDLLLHLVGILHYKQQQLRVVVACSPKM